MSQRNQYIQLALANEIRDIDAIAEAYEQANKFDDAGFTNIEQNQVAPMKGYFTKPVSQISDWGTISEITDASGNKRPLQDVINTMPDYQVYVDATGRPIQGNSNNSSTFSSQNNGVNPTVAAMPNAGDMMSLNPSSQKYWYTNQWGAPVRDSGIFGSQAIDPSNDLFYLMAPALGVEDVIAGRLMTSIGRGVNEAMRPIRNAKRTYDKAGRRFNSYEGKSNDKFIEDRRYTNGVMEAAKGKTLRDNVITDDMKRGLIKGAIDEKAKARMVYYRDDILEMRAKGYDTSEYELIAPEYISFCNKMGLDPNSATTAAQFIQRQSRSTRAIADINDPVKAEEVLTTAYNSRGDRLGGDQLGTDGGLYTSNNGGVKSTRENPLEDNIPNRFSTGLSTVDGISRGTVADLHTDFGIDPSLPPMEQIKAFKAKQVDGNMLGPMLNIYKGVESSARKKIYDSDESLKAVYGPYFGDKTMERVLITHQPSEQVAKIVDKVNTERAGHRTELFNRFGEAEGGHQFENGNFLPYNEALTPETVNRYLGYLNTVDAPTINLQELSMSRGPKGQKMFKDLMTPVEESAWNQATGRVAKRNELQGKIIDGDAGFAYKLFELLNPTLVKSKRELGKMENVGDVFLGPKDRIGMGRSWKK
jgi:hypothetical protein